MNEQALQQRLSSFQSALSEMRSSLGVIGGDSDSVGEIPDLTDRQEDLFEALTTAAITNQVRLVLDTDTAMLDKILRIEHQSWVRGETPSGETKVVNLMDVNDIEIQ